MPASVFAVIGDLLLGPVGRAAKLNCDNRKLLPGWPTGLEFPGCHATSDRLSPPPSKRLKIEPDGAQARPKSPFRKASAGSHSSNVIAAAARWGLRRGVT